MKLQKGFYFILSIALIASCLVPAAPERTVQAARAFEPALPQEMDEFGNVVREGEQFTNFLPDSEGNTVQVILDSQHNETGRETLARNPFASRSEPATLPDQGLGVPDLNGSNFPVSEEWKFSLYGSGIGAAGLFGLDLEGDGEQEIVAGANAKGDFGADNFWYVLRQTGINQYEQIWVSETFPVTLCQLIASDINQDGVAEVIIGLADASVHVISGENYSELYSFGVQFAPTTMIIADADQNGQEELIISDGTKVSAYNVTTGQLRWSLSSYGGDLAVGNVDQDADLEIVTSKGYVLNGKTRGVEWFYPASTGFGARVDLGDIDGDGMEEIVGANSWYSLTVFDADLKSPIWDISTTLDIQALLLFDVNGDGREEILYGDGQWGSVHCIDGLSQAEVWKIKNPEHGVTNLAVADVDQDSALELLWGAGHTSSGEDFLYIAGINTRLIEWKNLDFDGPLNAHDVGDVDDDGQAEIVLGTFSSNSGYGDGTLHIIDATTHALEWQLTDLPNLKNWEGIGSIRIADVDDDGTTEFAVATADLYDGVIQIYDGRSHTLERQSVEFSSVSLTSMEMGDVDGDGKTEIVVGQDRLTTGATGVRVVVLDGATLSVEWQSISMDTYWGGVYDVHLTDIDQDTILEIVLTLDGGKVYVFDGKTHAMQALINAQAISIWSADLDGNGVPSLLLGRLDGKIDVYNGQSFQLEKTVALTSNPVRCLTMADVNFDGEKEWLVCNPGSLSVFDANSSELLWRKTDGGAATGMYNQISTGELDGDGFIEIVWGSNDHLYQYHMGVSDPLGSSTMQVTPAAVEPGDTLTFTIELVNQSTQAYPDAQLDNPLPDVLQYVEGSLSASDGAAVMENHHLEWNGEIGELDHITITYQAELVKSAPRTTFLNTAVLTTGSFSKTMSASFTLNLIRTFLPVCLSPWIPLCGDFQDDFSNAGSGWAVSNDANVSSSYVSGEFAVTAKNTDYLYLFRAPTCKRSNYSVEMDARWAGTTGNGYGLIFDLDDTYAKYYLFLVNSDYQDYGLFRYSNGSYQTIADWTPSQAIRSGQQTNHLKVTRIGADIQLAINGNVVGTWKDQSAATPGLVGLVISPYMDLPYANARFDNFSVIELPAPASAGSSPDRSMNAPASGAPAMLQMRTLDIERAAPTD